MNKNIIILGVIAIIIGGFVLMQNTSTSTVSNSDSPVQETSEQINAPELSRYKNYTPELAATASDTQKVVLFFHASWCPTCKAANTEFSDNHDQIPENVLILKTDYDTSDELKRTYDVNYQHTFVQIDQNGEQITQWNGGGIDQIKARIQ